jgi:hypothetical protein
LAAVLEFGWGGDRGRGIAGVVCVVTLTQFGLASAALLSQIEQYLANFQALLYPLI